MNTRARIALAALVFACAFTAGITLGAHDYVAQISGATEGAFMLSGLSGNQLAGEGGLGGNYGGSPSPSPSPSTGAHTSNPGGGGSTGGGGRSGGSEGGLGGNYGGSPSPNGGTNGASDHGCGGGGCGSNTPTPGSNNNSTNGNTTNTSDSRDHQDTAASRAAEAQAQQTRQTNDAANYAKTLSSDGSGDPTAAARTPQSISNTVNNTLSALEKAMSNLMGGPAEPVTPQHVTGLDGNTPVYSGTGLTPGDFQTLTEPKAPQAPGYSTGAPTDYTKAMNTAATTDATPKYVTSAATQKALSILKSQDNQLVDQAAQLQKHLANKINTADAIVATSEIRKAVAGECASHACSADERVAIANAIMNRIDVAAANKATLDIHDVLDAFDANMQRPGTLDNKVYAKADIGTENYVAGAVAFGDALAGKLPANMPDAVKNATNYHTLSTHPDWAKGQVETPYGPHTFSDANGSTAEQVQSAKDKVAAGQVKAAVSFYNGMYNAASPQAAKVQSEVNRSLTVAGKNVNVVTQSTGVTQGPGIGQTTPAPDTRALSAVIHQQTSLDNANNSNVPSPADVKSYLEARGWRKDAPMNGNFAFSLSNEIAKAETATGVKAPKDYIQSSYRSAEEQAQIAANSLGHDYTYNGVTYHVTDSSLKGQTFAAPGMSRHQYSSAVDLKGDSSLTSYIRNDTAFKGDVSTNGLEKLHGSDMNHFQMSSATYFSSLTGKNSPPLDTKLGAGGVDVPASTQAPDVAPSTGWKIAGFTIPSAADIKQKAADAVKAVTPSEETQQKLSWVSSLPTWAQNIVISIYTGKGGTGVNTQNTGSHGGGDSFFPEAKRATTTISTRASSKVDVTTLPWWQQYQAKLNAIKQSKQQQSI